MTRETKIGLLVGLAFIIVIGILLSDHLTNSTEPPPATLAQTGSNVRETTTVPGGGTGTPIVTAVAPPQVQPTQPVPTPRELQPPTPATAIVQVGGPAVAPQPQPQPVETVQPPVPTVPAPASTPPITIVGNDPPASAQIRLRQSRSSSNLWRSFQRRHPSRAIFRTLPSSTASRL
jgi:hypothetical protein